MSLQLSKVVVGAVFGAGLLVPALNRAQTPAPASPSNFPPNAPAAAEKSQTSVAGAAAKPLSVRARAEQILHDGLAEGSAEKRAKAVTALGLIRGNAKARREALHALKDEKSVVRAAAADALGSMHATQARHALEAVLDDSEPSVVLAAANSLVQLHDDAGYNVYYGVLTGEQKASKGFVQQELAKLHDKKKLAVMTMDEGVAFVPFAGIPYTVLKMILKNDSSGVRAAAARRLADDPDPASTDALVDALSDKSWLVRAAAVQALALRRNRALLEKVAPSLDDDRDDVRYLAAACVLYLGRPHSAPAASHAPVAKNVSGKAETTASN